MRASSSWIKLQFVVRKHVMNTYQMHTLSLFLFYHIFSFFSPCPVSDFLSFWLNPRLSTSFPFFSWWSVILMWHIQLCSVMHPFVCTCVCICVCSPLRGTYVMWIWECCFSLIAVSYQMCLSQATCMCCGQLCANLFIYCMYPFNALSLSFTLSLASVGMSSFAGCSAEGLARWGGQEGTRIYSGCHWWHVPVSELTPCLGLRGERQNGESETGGGSRWWRRDVVMKKETKGCIRNRWKAKTAEIW